MARFAALPTPTSPPVGTPLSDEAAMRLALAWAEQAIGLSDPNPRVGCVLLDASGGFVGAGHTQAAGQAHAEVMALRQAAERGLAVRGGTAIVTLEPCAHHGRTPPCCDALLAAGIARAVIAVEDPNPLVGGQGLARMAAAGVTITRGVLADEAAALNVGFLHRMRTGRPWVRMKWAASLDGFTALPDGTSRWITGPEARRDGQWWRRRAGAVLTGIGTVLADDPRLDVRDWPTARQPLRVVLDTAGRLRREARVLAAPGDCLHVHGPHGSAVGDAWCAPLDATGRIDGAAVLAELGRRGVNELHIEAGATLNGAWLAAGWVNELLVYIAPKLLGQGRGVAASPFAWPLDDAHRWHWLECTPVGADLRLRLQAPG
ncbi:MAG: bifunctional diaminohydroxyphosphoribosylaminopyrimidine deaminase/5-amino-6-(5-phosphoribosylamino)uracil reductase RibD [Inhella sp.]|jgi:diaminohydroxyphosphoribosylaminopyrimidine deaminase/5-amino-6-(5-phosphoribosylamino)uracil reductase|uniref:bifunctional diaminohydroxyphosphoribosylaminopyrimidine deaminase/5-amino-6-(5-phosphoribosylamino)uracil reductase RibD n=1 Tax=Inhella sp. TaxID=1921806 RepID=UPI0022C329C5|nr:bifunctional diaminohydroxyphosphoribosylaminopyrimidine deaminase/5-amino-6-(5-phosphoribosylamino)uracil reductase RibD [Inhella sp.]MCZ8236416.1 bifunctional diaminohydroxyphosphoribosylaminopyrimidine deaminase/5-amino-6-(5-phosphoribosylamino)uracil reductase RibD [Inhella sp.]